MKKISLRKRLITIFVITSTIPIILLCLSMFYSTSTALRKNTEMLTQTSLKQMDDNMQIWLESYEDILYQLYTNDDVVAWVDKLNESQDVPVTINQLRRFLRGLLNTKDYIRSITIITESGMLITYNQLTPVTYANPWIGNFSLSQDELYEEVSLDNGTHIFSTEYGTRFANEEFYLFHLSHRIIDYRNLNKKNGIVILSLDEHLLRDILQIQEEDGGNSNTNFLVDGNGRIISCDFQDGIGKVLFRGEPDFGERVEKYEEYARKSSLLDMKYTSVYAYHDEKLNWDIVNITDQSVFMKELKGKAYVIAAIGVILLMTTLILVWKLSGQLVKSVNRVVAFMKKTEAGNLSIRVPLNEKMPIEIETVALQFNGTLKKLEYALQKEKEAGEKQRKAEIKALEAQINPHFLYNTLDTINWMAIEKDEFDISNAINSLATILRYAISDSSGMVSVRDEIEWLKKYIYLQQFRLKNKFVCKIEASPDILEYRMHKLLLQPFVENAIIHGFTGEQDQYILEVILKKKESFLSIVIRDNGKGMDRQVVEQVNHGLPVGTEEKKHIGLDNAITRLHMYCNAQGKIYIKSEQGRGTEIILLLPRENM